MGERKWKIEEGRKGRRKKNEIIVIISICGFSVFHVARVNTGGTFANMFSSSGLS